MSGFSLVDRWRHLRAITKDRSLSACAHAVAGELLDMLSAEGVAWPSHSTLARNTGQSRRNVANALDQLIPKYFTVERRAAVAHSNEYRPVIPACTSEPACTQVVNARSKDGELAFTQSYLKNQLKELASSLRSERARGAAPKRRSQVPENWQPDATAISFAEQTAGWSPRRIADEAAQFVDHHRKKGDVLADIPAGWRTWVRNGFRFDRNRHNVGPNGHPSHHDAETRAFEYVSRS